MVTLLNICFYYSGHITKTAYKNAKKYAKPKEVNRMERIITEYREPGGDGDGDKICYRVIL